MLTRLACTVLLLSGSWLTHAAESPSLSTQQVTDLVKSIRATKADAEILTGLQRLSQSALNPVPAQVSSLLVEQSILNENAEARKAAATAIRKLNDMNALNALFQGVLNERWKPEHRQRGAEGLRFIDNPVAVEKLVTIATTLLIRAGTAQFENLDTVFIKAPELVGANEDQNAHNAALSNPIRLPIELPTIELRSVNTAVVVMAVEALKVFAKRDIGADRMLWKDWLADWKHIRDVRVAQAREQAKDQ